MQAAPGGGGGEEEEDDAIFAEMENHGSGTGIPTRSVRTDTLRYLRNFNDKRLGSGGAGSADWVKELELDPNMGWAYPRVPEELYDIATDPTERINLVHDPAWAQPLAEMRQLLDDHLRATDDPRLTSDFETVM